MRGFILFLALAWPLGAGAGLAEGVAAYERGDGKVAVAQLRPLARQGDAEAQYYLGRLYFYRVKGMRQDYRAAARWFRRAAEQGHAAARYKLGGMYFTGRGVAQNDRQAAEWWRQAAQQGHAESQNNLGVLFANGRGVPRNPTLAYALQALALANGNELAAENLRSKEAAMSTAELEAAKTLAQEMGQPGMLGAVLQRYWDGEVR